MEELEGNLKMVDKNITVEIVDSYFEYKYIPEKTESHLINFILYDIETDNGNKPIPYSFSF